MFDTLQLTVIKLKTAGFLCYKILTMIVHVVKSTCTVVSSYVSDSHTFPLLSRELINPKMTLFYRLLTTRRTQASFVFIHLYHQSKAANKGLNHTTAQESYTIFFGYYILKSL